MSGTINRRNFLAAAPAALLPARAQTATRGMPAPIIKDVTVPLVLSTHHRYRSSPSATLRNTLLPQTIGVAPDLAGISSFQAMFSVVLQCSGRSFSVLMPFKEGPRHCGQFSASVGSEATARNT